MTPRLLIALTTAVTTGCAVVANDGTRMRLRDPQFAEYVEATFRLQNEVASALALAFDTAPEGSARYEALDRAEAQLLTACDGLNALAVADRGARQRRGLRALRVAKSAPECERAALSARAVLSDD